MALPEGVRRRIGVWREILWTPLAKVALYVYAFIGFVQFLYWLTEKVSPEKYQHLQRWSAPLASAVGQLSPKTWGLIFLGTLAAVLLEGSYRVVSGVRRRAETLQAQLAKAQHVQFEIFLGDASTYASILPSVNEAGEPAGIFTLIVYVAFRFHNHDEAPTTITDFRTRLWLSQSEEAKQLRLVEWQLSTPARKRLNLSDLQERIAGREVSGVYDLHVVKIYPAAQRAAAEGDQAFLRFTVCSLGNPDWHTDIPLRQLTRRR